MALLDAPSLTKLQADGRYPRKAAFSLRSMPGFAGLTAVMATPPTITLGTANAATTITGAYRVWPDRADAFAYNLPRNLLAYGGTFPDSSFFMPIAQSGTNNTTGAKVVPAVRQSFFHYGQKFEIVTRGGTYVRISVNGQTAVASDNPSISRTTDSNTYMDLVDFGSVAWRRIEIDYSSILKWGGINISPTDAIVAAQPLNPLKLAFVSDSFGEGTGANSAWGSWAWKLAQLLGVTPWSSSWGGTGYLNPNTAAGRTKVRDRLQADVLNGAPDVIIWAVSYNDISYATVAATVAEAQACWDIAKAALPNARHIIVSPWWSGGPETWSSALIQQHDAMKAAAAAYGFPFIDLLQQPATPLFTPFSTTIAANIGVGNQAVSTVARPGFDSFGAGGTVQIGSGSTVEYRTVKAWTGGGPFSLAFNGGFGSAHVAGETIKLVGASLWTGAGRIGTPGGTGNADVMVSSDAIHPTQAGHDMIARGVFAQLCALTAYPDIVGA